MTRTKKSKAIWVKTFPIQARALRPENSPAGGVKARSVPEAHRIEIYNAIRDIFIVQNPICKARCSEHCKKVYKFSDHVHHKRGRQGWLLVDVRHWLPVCATCHQWIGDNPEEAMKLGLIEKRA